MSLPPPADNDPDGPRRRSSPVATPVLDADEELDQDEEDTVNDEENPASHEAHG